MILVVLFLLLLAGPAQATIWYAGTGGSTSNCTNYQTQATRAPTIAVGLACMAAAGGSGHTLVIQAGTYTETGLVVPSGTSGSHTIIRADTTGTVTFTSNGSFNLYSGNMSYVDFIGNRSSLNLVWDGSGAASDAAAFAICQNSVKPDCPGENHHITFDGVRIHDWGLMGVYTYSTDNIFRYSRFDHNGMTLDAFGNIGYAFYMSGGSNNNLIEYSEIDNNGGYGIHIYSGYAQASTNHSVRFNRIHDNGQASVAAKTSAFGILLGGGANGGSTPSGSGNKAYGNLIYGEVNGGIVVSYNCNDCLVYNNTVYGSAAGTGIQVNSAVNTVVRNNIAHANGGGNLVNTGTNSTFSHNLCTSTCSVGTNNRTEPSTTTFNAAGTDFTLKAGSAAINNGFDLAAPYNTDILNVTRPVGAFDIGAYERFAPTCPTVSPALVASYSFEGNGADSTGNGHTAVLGSGWSYTGSGKIGQGALSNGTSGITVADHDALDPCAAFTYEGWINLANTAGNSVFIVKNPDSKAFLFASIYGYCGSGVPIGGYSETDQPIACSTTALTPGFKHLAVTYDSTLGSANVKVYLNGIQVSSANGTNLLSATTGTLQFCQSSFGELCPSGTVIDEVRIYNYARSASEILSSVTVPPVYTIKLDVSSIKIGPSVGLKVGVP